MTFCKDVSCDRLKVTTSNRLKVTTSNRLKVTTSMNVYRSPLVILKYTQTFSSLKESG